MDDVITYGVFWQTEYSNNKWIVFSAWYTSYDSAYHDYSSLSQNPSCLKRKIVERIESFEDCL